MVADIVAVVMLQVPDQTQAVDQICARPPDVYVSRASKQNF